MGATGGRGTRVTGSATRISWQRGSALQPALVRGHSPITPKIYHYSRFGGGIAWEYKQEMMTDMFRTLALVTALALGGASLAGPSLAGETAEPVILTVTGHVSHPNRGPVDPFRDAVFDHLGVSFDSGFTFTLAQLKALPQQTVTAQYTDWPHAVTASGPSLADVLKAAGAEGKTVVVQAADGYSPEFTGDDVARGKLILALEADGEPLAMGGRGPIWLFGPPDSFAAQEADEGFAFEVIRVDAQ